MRLTRLVLLALALWCSATGAQAHPHIFIDARLNVVFDEAGRVSRLDQVWTFDEAFSAWSVQGLDANNDGVTSPEELQELADENIAGLSQYHFYTYAGEGSASLDFTALPDPRLAYENGHVTLTYSIEPTAPYAIAHELEISVNDPEYYVAISFADTDAITLANAPPQCRVNLRPAEEIPPDIADQLYALPPDVTQLPPDLAQALRGVQGAILITCGTSAASAQTAMQAIEAVAPIRVTPFGGPPPEPGFNLPRTGVLGWVAQLQQDFYAGLTTTLSRLKSDGSAFWLLGGLSFLYGIIHAAGPGHGKVVIGSYVLANEAQARRAIGLSVISALLQSLVAVGFVLVAVLVLNMTSFAMNDATWWITVGSYGLVALLGLWLIMRKLFGLGHHHHHHRPARPNMAEKARQHLHGPGEAHRHPDHDHDHDHDDEHAHHVVTPAQVRGGWREQLGVVLAVGSRPCSGALVVLVFALSQGLLAAGIAAVFLMGLGTAITVAALALIAVFAKGLARRLMGGRSTPVGRAVLWWIELAGAVLVFAFGMLLLLATI